MRSNRGFWALFTTQFLGAMNDNFYKNVLVILITYKSVEAFGLDSKSLVAAAGGIFILPFFLFSGIAGQIADKFERSLIVKWTKIWELIIMAIASYFLYQQSYEALLILLFCMGLQSTFFGPIKYSMIADLVEKEDLISGNAYIGSGTFIAILLGTILGGATAAADWNSLAIASICGLAIIGIISSFFLKPVKILSPKLNLKWDPIRPSIDTIKCCLQSKDVYLGIVGISWFWFFGAALLSLMPVYAKEFLNASGHVATLFLACFTLGMGIGSLACKKLSNKKVEIGLAPYGALGMSIFLVDIFFINANWAQNFTQEHLMSLTDFFSNFTGIRIAFDFFMVSFFGGIFIMPTFTWVQKKAIAETRSRVIAGNNILNALFMVLSAVFIMLMHSLNLELPQIFLCLAILNLVIAIVAYHLVSQQSLRLLSWLWIRSWYRFSIIGAENIPKNGPCVLVCNHISYVDWLAIMGALKRPVRFVIYYKFCELPIMKKLLKDAKVIPIAGINEDIKILKSAMEEVSQALDNGELVCIFPEGGISRNGKLQKFRKGIEQIITRNPVPVIPMALNELWGSLFSYEGGKIILKKPKRFFHKINISIGKAIPPDELTVEELRGQVLNLLTGKQKELSE